MFESFFDQSKLFFEVSYLEQIFRLVLATVLGAILGFERELKNKPADSSPLCLFPLVLVYSRFCN